MTEVIKIPSKVAIAWQFVYGRFKDGEMPTDDNISIQLVFQFCRDTINVIV